MVIHKIKTKLFALMFWQTNLGDFFNKIYDLKVFYKYSFRENKLVERAHYQAYLTKQYHIVEKGLALPNSRKGFGKPKIIALINKSEEFQLKFGQDFVLDAIKMTLIEYLNNNLQLENEDKEYFDLINNFIDGTIKTSIGGVKTLSSSEIFKYTNIDFENFLKTRTSIRDFSKIDVEFSEIQKAVDLARNAPSVCNRQSWRLHYYDNEVIKNKLLKIQSGNNGFTDSINKLLIVTTDVHRFSKLESNQVYIDGGLFAMNLLLSLHSIGIGSCCLNTCFPFLVEKQVKKLGGIPESQRLIMMIGVGKLKDDFHVAVSNKISVNQILEQH